MDRGGRWISHRNAQRRRIAFPNPLLRSDFNHHGGRIPPVFRPMNLDFHSQRDRQNHVHWADDSSEARCRTGQMCPYFYNAPRGRSSKRKRVDPFSLTSNTSRPFYEVAERYEDSSLF